MEWYFYLNYVIYRFYKKKEDIPVGTAFLLTVLFVCLNILTIWIVYTFIYDFWTIPEVMENYKIKIILMMSFIGLINYLLLYRKKKYEDVFWEFRQNYDKYKKWDKSVRWYIILTIVAAVVVLIIAVIRNQYVKGLI